MADSCEVKFEMGGIIDEIFLEPISDLVSNYHGCDDEEVRAEIMKASDEGTNVEYEFEDVAYGNVADLMKIVSKSGGSYRATVSGGNHIQSCMHMRLDGKFHSSDTIDDTVVVGIDHLTKAEKNGNLAEFVESHRTFTKDIPPIRIVSSARERLASSIPRTRSKTI